MTRARVLKTLAAVLVLSLLAIPVLAQMKAAERTDPKLNAPAPQFSLTNVVTGQPVNLADYKGKIVVLTFQSINCPWNKMRESGGYERYLVPLSEKYADKNVVFLGINSNFNESTDDIAAYHKKHDIPYAFLKDKDNVVADQYNAKTTPHIFVIKDDDQQSLVYMGGVEQVPTSPEMCGKMDKQYLQPVLDALISGNELPYTQTTSKGCGIKRVHK